MLQVFRVCFTWDNVKLCKTCNIKKFIMICYTENKQGHVINPPLFWVGEVASSFCKEFFLFWLSHPENGLDNSLLLISWNHFKPYSNNQTNSSYMKMISYMNKKSKPLWMNKIVSFFFKFVLRRCSNASKTETFVWIFCWFSSGHLITVIE